jgi:hypothetical protein
MLSGRRLGWSAIRYTLNLSSCCADGEAFERKRRAAPVPPSPGRAGGLPRPAGRISVLRVQIAGTIGKSPDRRYDRQLSNMMVRAPRYYQATRAVRGPPRDL